MTFSTIITLYKEVIYGMTFFFFLFLTRSNENSKAPFHTAVSFVDFSSDFLRKKVTERMKKT